MTPRSLALTPPVLLTLASAAWSRQDAEQVYVLTGPEHSMEQVRTAYAEIPPLSYAPPSSRWQFLQRTASALAQEGGTPRVVMLGDTIVNDTSRSRWDDVLQDMTDAWGRYVRASGKDLNWFERDEVHANERGEQFIGRILATQLAPPLPRR